MDVKAIAQYGDEKLKIEGVHDWYVFPEEDFSYEEFLKEVEDLKPFYKEVIIVE